MKIIIEILRKAAKVAEDADGYLAEELTGDIAEYLAAVEGDWGSFDQPRPELVREVNRLFRKK